MASSVLESSEEKTYGFKLMRLIVDGGTEALRNVFLNIHPGNLHTVLTTHQPSLFHLHLIKKIITQPQWEKLYPHSPKIPNIQEFDITLLVILLRNICGLSTPSTGWNAMPISTDKSREADIVRIKLFRNNFFGHVSSMAVNRLDFEARWVEVSSTLRRLGLPQAEIDRVKAEECGEEEVNRVREKWRESDREVVLKLNELEKLIESTEELGLKLIKKFNRLSKAKSPSDDILKKNLHWCDFEKEIQLLFESFIKGTREWVFEQVSAWLNDKSSDNRAFIISGPAGMGKSTIAAVVCRNFSENFAASHFFQYNNSRYNNVKIFLQSLAWQLCEALPEYKENLIRKLSGKEGERLNNANIEGLYSMLFKEPLTKISAPDKHLLIVIDALDECRQEEKDELIDLIKNHFHKFPKFIRFLITARSEKDIARKFQKFNPVFLERDNQRNLDDLRLLLEDKLKTKLKPVARERLLESLVEKCEGLMLYASFLCRLSENNLINLSTESLPSGINEIYELYFNRLRNELKILCIDAVKFLSLLGVIAVAKQPLPLALIEKELLSSVKDLSEAKGTSSKLINCLSSLLVIKYECVSFFHKSVKDWLVTSDHDFTIHVKDGHKILAELCADTLKTLKQCDVTATYIYDPGTQYALQCGIEHMLRAERKELIDNIIDLEIVHASVCIDVNKTLINFAYLGNHNLYRILSERTQTTVNSLVCIIRKFKHILEDIPLSFLQHVVNEKDGELSCKASALLMTRYKEIAFFESTHENVLRSSFSSCSISEEGRYIYTSNRHGRLDITCTQCKQSWEISVKLKNTPIPVTNGVVFLEEVWGNHGEHDENSARFFGGTPVMWDSGGRQCLFNFSELLPGTCRCLISVAEDLIACVMNEQVVFVNVLRREIVACTPLPENRLGSMPYEMEVIACSSKYHVLVKKGNDLLLVQGENTAGLYTELYTAVQDGKPTATARFSPNACSLVYPCEEENELFIWDIPTLTITKSSVRSKAGPLEFIDDNYLLCGGHKNDFLCLINVTTGINTCSDVGISANMWKFSVSRKTGTIIVYLPKRAKGYKLIKLWLPHQRNDASELPELSCDAHTSLCTRMVHCCCPTI